MNMPGYVYDPDYDEFKTTSGLKDDFDGVVVDAWFAKDIGTQTDNLYGFLKILADDGEEVTQRYGLGAEWGSFDQGITVEHPKGAKHYFNNRAGYSEVFTAALKSGAEDLMRSKSKTELEQRGAKDARIWLGLRFHWEVKTETFTLRDKQSGEDREITTNRCLPTKFLGLAESGGTAATAGVVTVAKTSGQGVVDGSAENMTELADAATMTKLKVLAKTKTYSEFVDDAMNIPGAIDNMMLMTALADETLYNGLRV
jgi:hypothetical protein